MNLRWYYLIIRPVYQKRVDYLPSRNNSNNKFMENNNSAGSAPTVGAPATNVTNDATITRETVITGNHTVKEWTELSGFVELAHDYDKTNPNNVIDLGPRVRANTNGLLFVTFTNKQNKAENVYFSKNEALMHTEGEAIVKGFFEDLQVLEVTYVESGEMRLKLSKSSPRRTAVADLF